MLNYTIILGSSVNITERFQSRQNPVLLNKDITNNLSYQSKDNIDSKAQCENKMIDEMDIKKNLDKVKQQVKYDYLVGKYNNSQIDEIVELITWCND